MSRYFRVKRDDSDSELHRKCGWQIHLSSLGHRSFALRIDLPDLCLVTSLVFVSVAQFPEDWTLGNACTLGWRKWLLWRTGSLLLCAYLRGSEERPVSPRTSFPCSQQGRVFLGTELHMNLDSSTCREECPLTSIWKCYGLLSLGNNQFFGWSLRWRETYMLSPFL